MNEKEKIFLRNSRILNIQLRVGRHASTHAQFNIHVNVIVFHIPRAEHKF